MCNCEMEGKGYMLHEFYYIQKSVKCGVHLHSVSLSRYLIELPFVAADVIIMTQW